MAELSERSGVPVATIKYYLRERMLPAGEYTSPNQAVYGERHVDRLRLVRALLDVGGLSVSSVVAVLAAVDDESMPLTWAFGVAQHALPNPVDPAAPRRPRLHDLPEGEGEPAEPLHPELAGLFSARGWSVSADNPGIAMTARVLETYDGLGLSHLKSTLPAYAEAAEIIAQADLGAVGLRTERSVMVESVVVGTVLGDSLFAGLRRIAQEYVSRQVFPDPQPENP